LKGSRAAGVEKAGQRTFAQPDYGFGAGGGSGAGVGHEERTQEGGEVGVVADEEEVLALGALAEELLEVFEGGFGGERGGVENL